MKRQPRILAGSALGLLMASAPLGAYPLQGSDLQQALGQSGAQPVISIQAECPEGASAEDCAQGQGKSKGQKARRKGEGVSAPAEGERPAERQGERQKKREQAEPTQAEQAPPTESEQKPRKKRQKQQQAKPAPAEQAAPAAESEQTPRKQRRKEQKQAKPTQAEQPAAAPEQEQEPRKKHQREQKQAEPAPAETEQPSGEASESGSKNDKLRNYLKKKQGDEAAPAENEPAEQAAPAEKAAPKREQKPAQVEPEKKPAEATQPTEGEQPTEQATEPKSRKEKLRDYLKKKQGGEETAPTEAQQPEKARPAEEGQPTEQASPEAEQPATGETPPAAEQAEGGKQQATQPELPADTREQTLPKGEAKARPLPENAAPLPDSAKGRGERARQRPKGGAEQPEEANQERQQAEQPAGEAEAIPQSDSASQTAIEKIGKIESVEAVEGRRVDPDQWREERRKRREERRDRNNVEVVKEVNNRIIIKEGDNIYVDNRDVNVRLERHARDSYVEELPDDFSRYTIIKEDGTRVVTIRNANGDIVRRSRIMPNNREVVLYYVPETYYDRIEGGYADAGADLPPLQLDIPADQYILDAQYAEPDDYYTYLDAPPVEPVERIYSVDEVVHSARIRDKVRRIDLDTITFDTGSAEIGEDQVNRLQALGDAINKILEQNPAETFLIEGHTDAVGSDESNLVLSDERAQSVAEALTSVFEIPAENLTTQGYGEQYLKVDTEGESRENRRVAVRRITPLVAPVASNE